MKILCSLFLQLSVVPENYLIHYGPVMETHSKPALTHTHTLPPHTHTHNEQAYAHSLRCHSAYVQGKEAEILRNSADGSLGGR